MVCLLLATSVIGIQVFENVNEDGPSSSPSPPNSPSPSSTSEIPTVLLSTTVQVDTSSASSQMKIADNESSTSDVASESPNIDENFNSNIPTQNPKSLKNADKHLK